MAKGQRCECGVRRHSYKALPPPFRIRGFLGNRFRDLRFSEFPQLKVGRYLGLHAALARIADLCPQFVTARRNLCQPLRLSDYYCTAITPVFSPRFCFLQVVCCFCS